MPARYRNANGTYPHPWQGDIAGTVDMNGVTVVEYRYDARGKPMPTEGNMAETLGRDTPFGQRKDHGGGKVPNITNQISTGEEASCPSGLDFVQSLTACKAAGTIASIYWNDDLDHFSSGFVCAVKDGFVLLAHVGPLGDYDGFRVHTVEGVYKVKWGGKYERKIQTLYALKHQAHPDVPVAGSLTADLLLYAKANTLYISAELLHSTYDDIKGQVLDVDADALTVHLFNEYGDDDGSCTVSLKDITVLVCDSDEEAAIKRLVENR